MTNLGTNYAGNFEREICAYVTGQVGDCEVGQDISQMFSKDIKYLSWWQENIVQQQDSNSDYVILRPVQIEPTPGWFNNGMGGHYPDDDSFMKKAQKDHYLQVKKNNTVSLKEINRQILENDIPNGWTMQACLNEKDSLEQEIEQARISPVTKYPAYLSVAIFVKVMPPANVFMEFMERAKDFCKNRKAINLKLNGYDAKEEDLILTRFRTITEIRETNENCYGL